MTNKIRTSIQSVYEKLRAVLELYEKTDCYNTVPAGEKTQELYRKIRSGPINLKLACYPDRAMKNARKKYFQDAKKKYGGEDISDIEDKAFQDELLRTLELVFKNDLRVWIDRGNTANLKICF